MLLVDVGNSTLDCAAVLNNKIVSFFSASPKTNFLSLSEQFERITGEKPLSVVLASVNPPVSERLESQARKAVPVMMAKRDFPVPIECGLRDREEVGADRLLVSLAAHRRFGPSLVVDCGTAITFDLVSPNGVYLGGAISPGVGISAEALSQKCALLPKPNLPHKKPPLIGKSTQEALASGLLYGFASMIDRMVERFEEESGFSFCAIMTGGWARRLFPLCHRIADYIPHLVLEGLFIAVSE